MQVSHTSNEVLCNLFEALISRLDHMEDRFDKMDDQLDNVTAKLESIMLNKKHTDSVGHPFKGLPFSGLAHCGRCVELHADIRFDVEGVFCSEYTSYMLFLTSPEYAFHGDGSISWVVCPTETTYDEDLRSLWGIDKYDAIRSKITALHNQTGHYYMTCQDVGIESKHRDIHSALHELVLKHRVPAVVALGSSGIALKCTISSDIKSAVEAMDCASNLLGVTLSKYIQIHEMDGFLEDLALAFLREGDWRGEFQLLDEVSKNIARGMTGKYYSGKFFFEDAFN